MAIKEVTKTVTRYYIECDVCGYTEEDGDESPCLYVTKEYAQGSAYIDDWIIDGDKHYCPKCYTYDDDDNLIIKNKKQ